MVEDFRKLWRGEHSLATAFVLHFAVGQALIAFLILIVTWPILGPVHPLGYLLSGVGMLAYAVFAGLGVWRSGRAFTGSLWWVIGSRLFVCSSVAQLAFLTGRAIGQFWPAQHLTL